MYAIKHKEYRDFLEDTKKDVEAGKLNPKTLDLKIGHVDSLSHNLYFVEFDDEDKIVASLETNDDEELNLLVFSDGLEEDNVLLKFDPDFFTKAYNGDLNRRDIINEKDKIKYSIKQLNIYLKSIEELERT